MIFLLKGGDYLRKFKDGKTMYYVNSKDLIEMVTIVEFSIYPLGWGFMRSSDNNLYAISKANVNNFYSTKDEAEQSIYNIFTVMN